MVYFPSLLLKTSMELSRVQIEKWCGHDVFVQAEKFIKQGYVLKSETDGNTIIGSFAHNGQPVNCKFEVQVGGNFVVSHCPCYINRSRGQICIHVAAIALFELAKRSDPVRQQRYLEEQRHAKRIESVGASFFRRSPNGIPAKFLLELPGDFLQQFAKGAVAIRTIVLIGDRPILLEKIPSEKAIAFSVEDNTIIDVLEDMAEEGLKSVMTLNRIDFLGLLDVCRGKTLYVEGGAPQIVVKSHATAYSVYISMNRKDGTLILQPHADIPNLSTETSVRFLAELEKSFAFVGNALWPLKPSMPLPYHGLYTETITIPREGIVSFMSQELPRLSAKVPITYEEGLSPDIFTEKRGTPHFTLNLSGALDATYATLFADYGEKESGYKTVPAASPIVPGAVTVPDPTDLCNFMGRNLPAERMALARITAFGFSGGQGDMLLPVKGNERKILNILGGLIPVLRRLGWTVNVSGRLGRAYDEMSMVVPIVKIDNSSAERNHFNVLLSYEDGAHKRVPQPALQQAINRGDSFFSFEGRRLLIDSDAIESMRRVFADCETRAGRAPGSFQLSAVYAPYVDASLNALDGIDVERPDSWRVRAEKYNREAKLSPECLGELDGVLRPYQKSGVYWMRFLEKSGFCGILADEMGLGKTLQTLAWLSLPRIDSETAGAPALVIAPTSLVENWHRECKKFTPSRKCLVMQGALRHDHWGEVPKADLVITSYALLRRDLEHYEDYTFSAIVLDEAQQIKNRTTQNALSVKSIRAKAKLVLSGTPIENSVADIWSIMDFLMPGYLLGYESFKENYEIPIASGGAEAEDAQRRLHKKLRPFLLRRVKKDVAKDLPEKIIKVSYSRLSPEQEKVYSALLAVYREKIHSLVAAKGFGKCRMDVLAMLLRLRQAACSLALLPPEMLGKTDPNDSSGKVEQFLQLLSEAIAGRHRLLVFSQYVGMLSILRKTLEERGIRYCYLDGSTKDRDRKSVV